MIDTEACDEYWGWIYGELGISWEYPDEDPEEDREKSGESS